ncbi:MAG: CHAT domain-containing protein, partial [Nannocystaceae bacterium]
MTYLTLSLDVPKQQLIFRVNDHPSTQAPFDARDTRLLRQLSVRYSQAMHEPRELAAIGGALAQWLDAKHAWFERVLDADLPPPLQLEIHSPARLMTRAHAALINAPWELLHHRDTFLCIDTASMLIPARRIGTPAATHASAAPLGILFMAAAPADQDLLDFEQEESAILESCRHLAVNIAVEETGTLLELRAHLSRRRTRTHILHLVCHGIDNPPGLILEDDLGRSIHTTPDEIYAAIGPDRAQSLGLLFLSACFTASPDVASLALGLARANFPAILGWASAVRDKSARTFAAKLFAELARGDTTLQVAVAQARRDAYLTQLPDWHLARLYLGPNGGGQIISNIETPVSRPPIAFLDETNRRLQVASFETFVGRRTELKSAIRHLRQPEATTLLIHGPGFSGKSSLAARIASRMEHRKVVIHKVFVAAGIFESLYNALGSVLTDWYISTRRLDDTPASEDIRLFHYLRDLLDNHLPEDQPILLILDDCEHALEQVDGSHRPTAMHVPLITALVRAFNTTRSKSRLLITSRFAFSLASLAQGTEIQT